MPKKKRQKLPLDQPAIYQIKVPGELDMSRSEWIGDIKIHSESEDDGYPISILTGSFDQAALQGFLRRLYFLGLPIISVTWTGQDRLTSLEEAQK